MPAAHTASIQELLLALEFLLGRHFLRLCDLHYGLWPDGLPVTLQNLPQAQQAYTAFLLGHIPHGVKTVLDVGCGAGYLARQCINQGYAVDCVSPNAVLNARVREELGSQGTVFECRLEDLKVGRRYDLILFSESLQFIQAAVAVGKSNDLLERRGYLLLCDRFYLDADTRPPDRSGQTLTEFRNLMARSPFVLLTDIDLTSAISPTFTLIEEAYANALKPAYEVVRSHLTARHPWLMRWLQWQFSGILKKFERTTFIDRRERFVKSRSYRLCLFQKRPEGVNTIA